MSACSKIRHIVRIRQMLRRWRKKAATAARLAPSDVPAGHVAVTVGSSCKRFVVRTAYLNHPVFKKLLVQAEEEYGFVNSGPLAIPCDESLFEEILRYLARNESGPARLMSFEDFQRYCHVGFRSNLEFWADSRPLLHGGSDKSIWWVGKYIFKNREYILPILTRFDSSELAASGVGLSQRMSLWFSFLKFSFVIFVTKWFGMGVVSHWVGWAGWLNMMEMASRWASRRRVVPGSNRSGVGKLIIIIRLSKLRRRKGIKKRRMMIWRWGHPL